MSVLMTSPPLEANWSCFVGLLEVHQGHLQVWVTIPNWQRWDVRQHLDAS